MCFLFLFSGDSISIRNSHMKWTVKEKWKNESQIRLFFLPDAQKVPKHYVPVRTAHILNVDRLNPIGFTLFTYEIRTLIAPCILPAFNDPLSLYMFQYLYALHYKMCLRFWSIHETPSIISRCNHFLLTETSNCKWNKSRRR